MNQKIKEIKLLGNEVVVQDNILIDAPHLLTLTEQKLFLFLVSKLDPEKPDDILFRIPINEFAITLGIENTTSIYSDVRKIIKNLMSRVISIKKIEEGCKTTTDIAILGYAKYWHGQGYADIKISSDIAPYLFELKTEFTQYKLSQISTLSSIYAIRIYELLKKHEKLEKRKFILEDLRLKLNIKNKYKSFKDFRVRVLEIAKREINAKTDLIIDFKFQKAVRKIIAVEFTIKSKQTLKQKDEIQTIKSTTKIDKKDNYDKDTYTLCLKEIMDFGFSETTAKNITNDLDNTEIKNAIVAVKKQIKLENVNNPKAMLRTALKEKWNSDMYAKKLEIKKNIKPKKLNFLQSISKLFQR